MPSGLVLNVLTDDYARFTGPKNVGTQFRYPVVAKVRVFKKNRGTVDLRATIRLDHHWPFSRFSNRSATDPKIPGR